jgi:hypothetical protein
MGGGAASQGSIREGLPLCLYCISGGAEPTGPGTHSVVIIGSVAS